MTAAPILVVAGRVVSWAVAARDVVSVRAGDDGVAVAGHLGPMAAAEGPARVLVVARGAEEVKLAAAGTLTVVDPVAFATVPPLLRSVAARAGIVALVLPDDGPAIFILDPFALRDHD